MNDKIIAFQGTIGANSDLACRKFYPEFSTKSFATFSDVFDAVAKGEVEKGMIPLENSYAGRVTEIHNLLQNSDISITAEHFFKVSHNLAAIAGTKISEIKDVYSHPQALMQCKNNLKTLAVKTHEFSNTAKAAEFVAQSSDESKAALCSKLAAEINGLKIIKENMQDLDDNMTTFIVISKTAINPDPKESQVITTLLFTIPNIAGSLYRALGSFANNDVSMLKLESYIPGGVSKEAKFFITIEGHPSEEKVAKALVDLKSFCAVKMLGSYYADNSRLQK